MQVNSLQTGRNGLQWQPCVCFPEAKGRPPFIKSCPGSSLVHFYAKEQLQFARRD